MHATATLAAPFVPGERLDADAFLRRWDGLPDLKRAELVNGRVAMPSPVGLEHSDACGVVVYLLNRYRSVTPGTLAGSEVTVRLGSTQVPQPDAYLRVREECGGASCKRAGLLVGPPELVVEVSDSSVGHDLSDKRAVYEAVGVRENVVLDLPTRAAHWFVRRGETFADLEPDASGVLRSEAFPGLWFDAGAFFEFRFPALEATLAAGLATPEHAPFAQALAKGGSA